MVLRSIWSAPRARAYAMAAGAVGAMACASGGSSVQTGGPIATIAVPESSIFAPLRVPPPPSAIRLANGAPGPKYWQNRADYDLAATLDTTAGMVRGSLTLRYTNNSPDALPFIWFQTEQNASRKQPPTASGSAASGDFGYVYDKFAQMNGANESALTLEDHGTVTKVALPSPLAPGATTTFRIEWHFIVPPGGGRMGRERSLYEIAQWYPRVNVYDDVKGWNIEPYLGQGEFYLEYGDFTLAVTVPSNYIVAATGVLQNPTDVLTAEQQSRLAAAARGDSVVRIVTQEELGNGKGHLKHDGMVTWKFAAKNVRDAVWCASPEYQWDATAWNGIMANAYYRGPAAATWKEAASYSRTSIQEYSERWFPYPYPQVSVCEGPTVGMEYPMLSMDAAFTDPRQLYDVLTHEIGHNWFPMIVGSNERVHTWMDEGFNQFINTFSNARRFPERDQNARAEDYRGSVENQVAHNADFKVDIPADSVPGQAYGFVGYFKPAGILQMLRRDVMGPETFDRGMREYVKRWAFKHPTPQDFFRTMNGAANRDLSWFWREWIYETPGYDQSVDSVSQSGNDVTVVYGNRGRGVLPILTRFTFSDSTTSDVTEPADVWIANSVRYTKTYALGKTVTKVEIDPDRHVVDGDRTNNVWRSGTPASVPTR